jgi:hypothetical protein
MRAFSKALILFAALGSAFVIAPAATPPAPAAYVPQAVYCYQTPSTHGPVLTGLCPNIPGDIGADPELHAHTLGYKGVARGLPTSFDTDVETPFDNYSWQTFVALNWRQGMQNRFAKDGLAGDGPRAWEGWKRISQVFGNSPVTAKCMPLLGEETFSVAAKLDGTNATRNEEYIQAATGKPAIDVNGNWTLYERRVNNVEIAYLKAPGGNKSWDLTTLAGQINFGKATQTVSFPYAKGLNVPNGAMEIKAAWRILDPKNHAANVKRFYTVRALVAVAPALTSNGGQPVCAHVDLGLVAMHIIQRNAPTNGTPLKPQWFWTTFEHVDNAPLAAKPCDITQPAVCSNDKKIVNVLDCPAAKLLGAPNYSYFNPRYATLKTNQWPDPKGDKVYLWNAKPPYAKKYLTSVPDNAVVGTQISRCWGIYPLTQQLNAQWQAKLRAAGSVFANYMLIGTQWGTSIEGGGQAPGPEDAAPNYLSNSVVETYLQTFWPGPNGGKDAGFNTGSCVSCHSLATLTTPSTLSADLSFLPSEVNLLLARREFLKPIPK